MSYRTSRDREGEAGDADNADEDGTEELGRVRLRHPHPLRRHYHDRIAVLATLPSYLTICALCEFPLSTNFELERRSFLRSFFRLDEDVLMSSCPG